MFCFYFCIFVFLSLRILAQEVEQNYSFDRLIEVHKQLSENALKTSIENAVKSVEGNIADVPKQTSDYYNLSRTLQPKFICEIGFNAGHSACAFLFGSPRANYLGFDLGSNPSPVLPNISHGRHNYTNSSIAIIKQQFNATTDENDKINVIIGDSTQTVPIFHELNPNFRCDVIHIDGGHFGNVPVSDLKNMALLSKEDGSTVVLLDDAVCEVKFKSTIAGCLSPADAWKTMKESKVIVNHKCTKFTHTRSYCSGNYASGARLAIKTINVTSPEYFSPVLMQKKIDSRTFSTKSLSRHVLHHNHYIISQ